MEGIKTGWERDKRTHFDEITANYDKVRWEYPSQLYTDIFAYQQTGPGAVALEIGAGTGKATVPFLTAGYAVTAVELGANMVEFLLDKLKDYRGFQVMASAFEEAELTDDSYDLVYAASAFHWVDAQIGCPKVFRLLKRGGVFALFRNHLVGGYGFDEDIQELYEKYYLSIYPRNTAPAKKTRVELSQPSEIKRGYGFDTMEQYGFTEITMKFYEATRIYTADDYIALLETYADHRSLPESNKAALYAGIKKSIMGNGGYCKQDYLFQLYMGRKP